jgi:hypothetical protein
VRDAGHVAHALAERRDARQEVGRPVGLGAADDRQTGTRDVDLRDQIQKVVQPFQ